MLYQKGKCDKRAQSRQCGKSVTYLFTVLVALFILGCPASHTALMSGSGVQLKQGMHTLMEEISCVHQPPLTVLDLEKVLSSGNKIFCHQTNDIMITPCLFK